METFSLIIIDYNSSHIFATLRAGFVMPVVSAGLSAYVNKQGSVFHTLAVRLSQRWRSTLVSLALPHTWATKFLETYKEPLTNLDFEKHKQTGNSPAARTPAAPPPPIATSTNTRPLPTAPKTTHHDTKVSDFDSDEPSSRDNNSGYKSNCSFSD